MEEKCYGFLCQRILVGMDTYIFRPINLLEGYFRKFNDDILDLLDNEEYVDNLQNRYYFETLDESQYCLADDVFSIDSDNDFVVFNTITESELEKNYGENLDEAKIAFASEIELYIYVGLLSYTDEVDKMIIIRENIEELSDKINSGGDFDITPDIGNMTTQIYFDKEVFDNLLQIDNFKDLKSALEEIAGTIQGMQDGINGNVTANYIRSLYRNIYDTLLGASSLENMRELLSSAEEAYLELTYNLNNLDHKTEKKVSSLLIDMAEDYSRLLEINNLDEIKKNISDMRRVATERCDRLVEMYEQGATEEFKSPAISEEKIVEEKQDSDLFDVKDIKRHFDEKIIGQEEAKRDVIAAIYMNKLLDDRANKNNCLLVGPTGSGKTLIAETVAEYLDIPIEIIDTTQLTAPGYVGADLEDFLERLLATTKGDLQKAENGIVVFDEIDKKGSDSNSDISGKGVLNTLLPFISGTKYNVTYNRKNYQFDTSKLTIFATGAFTDLVKDKNTIYNGSKMGFESTFENSKEEDIKYHKFENDDFVKKGNMPAELIGRFSVITQLSGHTMKSLRKILTESNASALLSEKAKLEKINVSLEWTDSYLDAVSKKALELKTGARSLKSTVEKSIKDARWEVLNSLDIYRGIILTENSIEDNRDCILVDIYGSRHNLKDILNAKEKTAIKVYKK